MNVGGPALATAENDSQQEGRPAHDMCTTGAAGKVDGPDAGLGVPRPFIKPSLPHTMCASGKYTSSIQPTMNSMMAEYFMRSAMAPTISAGVMMANIIWYMENTLCETHAPIVRVGRVATPFRKANLSDPRMGDPLPKQRL